MMNGSNMPHSMKPRAMHWKSGMTIGPNAPHSMKPREERRDEAGRPVLHEAPRDALEEQHDDRPEHPAPHEALEMRWKSGATIGSGADDHKADDEAE